MNSESERATQVCVSGVASEQARMVWYGPSMRTARAGEVWMSAEGMYRVTQEYPQLAFSNPPAHSGCQEAQAMPIPAAAVK